MKFVTTLWRDDNYRARYTPEHVNIMARMIDRNYRGDHEVICYTDQQDGFDHSITVRPLWNDWASVPNPTGGGRPSCYRRLRLFDPAVQDEIGGRFVSIDLDMIITGDLTAMLDRPEPMVMWRIPHNGVRYGGCLFMLTPGCAPEVWHDFDAESPAKAAAAGWRGSDQAWLSYKLPEGLPTFGREVVKINPRIHRSGPPGGTSIVACFGDKPPWTIGGWAKEHYR